MTTIEPGQLAALFAAMAVLAAVPGVSVLAITSRAAAGGFRSGAWCAAGVVAGDLVFIAVALSGWAWLGERSGGWWELGRYLAAAWLIVLGIKMVRADGVGRTAAAPPSGSSSFLAGLLITLADQKAVLFYLGFFPAFFDMAALTAGDAGWIAATAVIAVGGVKVLYAALVHRVGARLGTVWAARWTRLAGAVLVGCGLWLAVRG